METKGRISMSGQAVNRAEDKARVKPVGSDDKVTKHFWKNNFIRMVGDETRLQPKESSEDVDAMNVVMLFQKVCQGLEGKRG